MDTAQLVGLAHRNALERRLDVVAHNVANMSTTAFNKEKLVFRQFLVDAPGAAATTGGQISYVLDHGIVRNLEEGTLVYSDNPLDVFISKGGYLAVEDQNGETVYTRNGRMKLDADNFLTLLSGERVLDVDENPIQFADDDIDILIGKDGALSTNNGELGQLGIFTFQNEQAMRRKGASLYETNQTPLDPENATDYTITQRGYESSNVNAIESLVEMTDVLRAYQRATQSGRDQHELRADSLDRLARVQ